MHRIAFFATALWAVTAYGQIQQLNDPHAISLVRQSLNTSSSGVSIRDVTLMGTVRRIAGPDDETGAVIAKALATGESRVDYNFPSGQRSEIRTTGQHGATGKWSGPEGSSHMIAPHNLLVDDSSWFSPAVTLQKILQSPQSVITYAGTTTLYGQTVEQLIVSRKFPSSPLSNEVMNVVRKASQVTLYLSESTSLPVAISYNTHPDNDIRVDIPIEIRFSDYRNVNGCQLPFHVQKLIRGGLALDVQFNVATVNSGLSAASMNLQ